MSVLQALGHLPRAPLWSPAGTGPARGGAQRDPDPSGRFCWGPAELKGAALCPIPAPGSAEGVGGARGALHSGRDFVFGVSPVCHPCHPRVKELLVLGCRARLIYTSAAIQAQLGLPRAADREPEPRAAPPVPPSACPCGLGTGRAVPILPPELLPVLSAQGGERWNEFRGEISCWGSSRSSWHRPWGPEGWPECLAWPGPSCPLSCCSCSYK